jgi:hypothetical protein
MDDVAAADEDAGDRMGRGENVVEGDARGGAAIGGNSRSP